MMIAAAYEALAEAYPGPVSVSKILAEAGLSTRSFYRHFQSKDELLLAMFQAESDRATQRVEKLERCATSPRAALETWIEHYLSLAFEPRLLRRSLIVGSPEVSRVVGFAKALNEMRAAQRAPLERILRAGAADGTFRHTEPVDDAVAIQDLVFSLLNRAREGSEHMNREQARARILDFVARAIGLGR
ncbi:MAG TPA: TetR/AcrR family transcriptional regulator [Amycolatopsis sp.]|nr:TetR/AcrR family transcriptional regulator [Amycolatopsis sp.]